ncbi:MAG: ribosomal RNA small subunit methyltransferase A, partial [Lachnospiraceae bacterium]|nr:ribosomal RNA small subunit methyltransferase A [Lachnospiraceae bacterium]
MEKRIHAKKRFGQNFLTDEAILEEIAESAQLTEEDVVLEIGPGTGALTTRLAARAKRVVAVEIDGSLREQLGQTLSACSTGMNPNALQTADGTMHIGNVAVLFTDILKTDLAALRAEYNEGKAFKVVANLPYYISTPVILKLLQDAVPPLSCTVMVQKELAERMCAAPGGKEYGTLSVAVQYYATPESVCEVPPHAFRPQPKVTSAVVRLVPLETPPVRVKNPDF